MLYMTSSILIHNYKFVPFDHIYLITTSGSHRYDLFSYDFASF